MRGSLEPLYLPDSLGQGHKALTSGDHSCRCGHLTALQQSVECEAILSAWLQPFQLVAGYISGKLHFLCWL